MYYLGATELDLPGGASIGQYSTPFNIGQVASIIFEFEGDVDGYAAAAGYAVPVATGATYAYASMRRAIRNGVTAYVLQTMFPNVGGPGDKANVSSSYQAAYDAFRKALRDGSLTLVGAAKDDSGGGRAGVRTGGSPSQPIDLCTQF